MFFITLVSAAMAFPAVTLSNDWGEGITDYIAGNAKYTLDELMYLYPQRIPLPIDTVKFLYPFASGIYTLCSSIACMFLLGLLLLLVSMVIKKANVSIAVPGILVFLDPILTWRAAFTGYFLQAFSPVCWTSIEILDILQPYYYISIPFVLAAYTSSIFLLLFLIYQVNKRDTIDIV